MSKNKLKSKYFNIVWIGIKTWIAWRSKNPITLLNKVKKRKEKKKKKTSGKGDGSRINQQKKKDHNLYKCWWQKQIYVCRFWRTNKDYGSRKTLSSFGCHQIGEPELHDLSTMETWKKNRPHKHRRGSTAFTQREREARERVEKRRGWISWEMMIRIQRPGWGTDSQ